MNISKLAILVALGTALSVKADTTFSVKSSFVSALPSGYFYTNFAGLAPFSGPHSSLSFSGGTPTLSYQITAPPSGLFVNNDSGFNAVGNWNRPDDLLITFNTPVYAVGAEFYLTDIDGVKYDGSIAMSFSTGANGTAPSSASGPYGFFGILSDNPITSMTVTHDAVRFLNMANFYTAVPEPGTATLVLVGAGLALIRRRG